MNISELTGPQRAMYLVLNRLYLWKGVSDCFAAVKSPPDLEQLYILEKAADDGEFSDALEVTRNTFIDTTLPAPPVRGFDVKAVAYPVTDGTDGVYVGWYHLSGGDKPEAFDWVNSAFCLTATTEEVVTVKYHFTPV